MLVFTKELEAWWNDEDTGSRFADTDGVGYFIFFLP
jgi:hypothetical protein